MMKRNLLFLKDHWKNAQVALKTDAIQVPRVIQEASIKSGSMRVNYAIFSENATVMRVVVHDEVGHIIALFAKNVEVQSVMHGELLAML
uniref:Uncharacterized protein n=1 Tax=Cannabis sativa TaxID=3483 RepID=A0A803PCP4_CANSA